MYTNSIRKRFPVAARLARKRGASFAMGALLLALSSTAFAWTFSDLNPLKHIRECKIFSLTRANPIGVRIMIVPVIDDPINAPIYTRLGGEFANALRSFANEVWLITDLPNNPIKKGFYTGLPRILADYRMRNYLSMDLMHDMIPDFECDYVALFEVTDYDRFWIDQDLQHRVGVRAVFYDYDDGEPRLEKYAEGGRGRRLEEGAFSEAERIAIKELVQSLEIPLRESIAAREAELAARYNQTAVFAELTAQRELAVHEYDLGLMHGHIDRTSAAAMAAQELAGQTAQERDYWREQALEREAKLKELETQVEEALQAMKESGQAPATSRQSPPAHVPQLIPEQTAPMYQPLPKAPAKLSPTLQAKKPEVIPPRLETTSSNGDFFAWDGEREAGRDWEYVGPDPEPAFPEPKNVRYDTNYEVIRIP